MCFSDDLPHLTVCRRPAHGKAVYLFNNLGLLWPVSDRVTGVAWSETGHSGVIPRKIEKIQSRDKRNFF